MAVPPIDEAQLIERFGPHLQYEPPGGWQDESRRPAEKLVKTHCCFCGQQCGIQLKVRDKILPAALISGVILAACFGLYLFIRRIDSART